MIDPIDLPKINASPPYTAKDLVRILIGSRKISKLNTNEVVNTLTIGGWMHHLHNTGDMEADTLTAHGVLKQECCDLADELDKRLDHLAAVENSMMETLSQNKQN